MTDLTLTKLCEKKINEACGKLPKEKGRVLAAMLSAVLKGMRDETLLAEHTTTVLKAMDEIGMPRPAYLRGVEFR
jgi:hypothetical protein